MQKQAIGPDPVTLVRPQVWFSFRRLFVCCSTLMASQRQIMSTTLVDEPKFIKHDDPQVSRQYGCF